MDKSGKAIKLLNWQLRSNRRDIKSLLNKAMIYSIDLKLDKSIKIYDKVLKYDSRNVDALILKGELLFGRHKYDEAMKHLIECPTKNCRKAI